MDSGEVGVVPDVGPGMTVGLQDSGEFADTFGARVEIEDFGEPT
jgi:hypothetical protein